MNIVITVFAAIAYISLGLILTVMILFVRAKCIGKGKCKIEINEDDSLTKEVSKGQTLLSALEGSGIAIPSPCGGKATCKQCKVQIAKGEGLPLPTDVASFSRKQLQKGWRLSCQSKVKNDLHLIIPEHLLEIKELVGKVISNENVATFIKEIVIEIPEEIKYRSGGYMQIHTPPYKTNTNDWKSTIDPKFYVDWEQFGLFGKTIDYSKMKEEVVRAYSMASYPEENKKLIFNVRIASPPIAKGKVARKIPWGVCSSYLFSLKPGDEVKLSGAYGESFMIEDNRELVFLIGGAGSSFGRSHILNLFRKENTKRKVTLWYGARSLKENIYQEEYKQLEKEFDNFSYCLALSEPGEEDIAAGWPTNDSTKTNFLFKAFKEGQLKQMESPEDCLFYVCGPPMHNSSVIKLLEDYGVEEESIILDDFGS